MKHKRLTTQFIRRLIFMFFTVFAFIIQCIILPRGIPSLPVYILLPLLISISMYEREFTGLFFGLFAGALWDLASPLTDGFLALVFAAGAYIIGLLSRYILRNTMLSQIVLTVVMSVLYSLFMLIHTGFSSGTDILGELALRMYLPALIFTVLAGIPIYFSVRKISVKFRYDKLNS